MPSTHTHTHTHITYHLQHHDVTAIVYYPRTPEPYTIYTLSSHRIHHPNIKHPHTHTHTQHTHLTYQHDDHLMCVTHHTSSTHIITHIDREKPPPPGGFPIYYDPSSRTVCKRTPLEGFVPGSSRGVLLHTVLDEGS